MESWNLGNFTDDDDDDDDYDDDEDGDDKWQSLLGRAFRE